MIKILKWAAIGIGSLIGLILLLALGLYVRGRGVVQKAQEYTAASPAVTTDSASIARGQHIVNAIAPCAMCHGAGLKGQMFPIPAAIVSMAAPNLTKGKGGVGGNSPALWAQAIRGGIGSDGRPLLIMPSHQYAHMSDADLAAVIAYLGTIPPVDNELAPRKLGPAGAIIAGLGKAPLAPRHIAELKPQVSTVRPGETAEYGAYLLELGTCTGCHGAELEGTPGFGAVPAPSLRTLARGWTEEQFRSTMRTGRTPEGRALLPVEMPWPFFSNMTDAELKAIWLNIRSRPALET